MPSPRRPWAAHHRRQGDVDAAVAAARHAFDRGGWSDLEPTARAEILARFVDELQQRTALIIESGTAGRTTYPTYG
ncbi:aldehyde dehydrogenase family protein [Streptomyces coeruleorubidus]|uniref:aldehyde dehydrogenase family protein n=1 Tax=Streptomyces coeruleorubidus TaxID=116188 RepID=UPI0036AD31EA